MRDHPFWGVHSPLTSLAGSGLMVICSGRISTALIACAVLVWVYSVTVLAAKLGGGNFPQWGREAILLFLSAFIAGIFFILLWIFDPLLSLECAFFILLVPAVFTASALYARVGKYDTLEAVSQSLSEALLLGMLILALALIREPLGHASVSFPVLGQIRFLDAAPLKLFQSASGALILLGYGTAVYRSFRNQATNSEDD
jgi:hypothetical protein